MEQLESKVEEQDSELENFESEEEIAKKRKREIIFEMTLFLILGVLLGITIKTEAVKKITIGFNDYQITSQKNVYNIGDMKANLDAQLQQQQADQAIQNQQEQSQNQK